MPWTFSMHFLLAMRLIRHEARTFIIRQWTGLSDDRIRKLYRCYVLEADSYSVMRHRGKSPRQTAFFFRNPELCFQASQLASLFIVYGLLYAGSLGLESRYRLGSLDSGALLCQAYEAYIELHTPARISFEHAWFLLMALARREEIGAARCAACGGVRLKDLLAKRQSSCANCEPPGAPPPAAAGSASSGAEVDHACTQPGVRGLARYPANGLR